MKYRWGNVVNVMATGFVVLVIYSLLLFGGRETCLDWLFRNMSMEERRVVVQPSGLVAGEGGAMRSGKGATVADPNTRFSTVRAELHVRSGAGRAISSGRSLVEMFERHRSGTKFYEGWNADSIHLCFRRKSGLLEYRREYPVSIGGGKEARQWELFFAGPNGVSTTASASLGRYEAPIVGYQAFESFWVYDRRFRRFYFVDFDKGLVSEGMRLAAGDERAPIALGEISEGGYTTSVWWELPEEKVGEKWKARKLFLPEDRQPNEGRYYTTVSVGETFAMTLDKTGRIHLYDAGKETLTEVGHLPTPDSLFSMGRCNEAARPRDVSAYRIEPFCAVLASSDRPREKREVVDTKYLGCAVACASREGMAMALAVFDANGGVVYCGGSEGSDAFSTAKDVYWDEPGASLVTTIEFLLENLQPAVLQAASYLCGDCFEAAAGHRALFILPNSFMGMLGRGASEDFLRRPARALLLMGPGLILSAWLAWRIRKDATAAGVSARGRAWWVAGTIAFGLPAYITYRLTRDKGVLVTCQNCGMLRRPDMETCHRCGSKWEMPELAPPSWRICD